MSTPLPACSSVGAFSAESKKLENPSMVIRFPSRSANLVYSR
jgi:hypothetical protein